MRSQGHTGAEHTAPLFGGFRDDARDIDVRRVKATVLETIRKTQLGRSLLGYLESNDIKLVVTTEFPAIVGDAATHAGLYDGGSRKLYLNAAFPLPALMHTFAHETRHVAQFRHDFARHDENVAHIDPLGHVHFMRLREMDADAFAVYFLLNHALETKEELFGKLSEPEGWGVKSGFLFAARVPRTELYKVFYDAWFDENTLKDAAHAMRRVFSAVLHMPGFKEHYDAFSLKVWRKRFWESLVDNSKDHRSAFSKSFAKAARKKPHDLTEMFKDKAGGYSRLFAEWGSPDYLAGIDLAKVVTYVAEEESARVSGDTARQLEEAREDFKQAVEYYAKMPLVRKKPVAKTGKSRKIKPSAAA